MQITEAVYNYFLHVNNLEDTDNSKLLFEVEVENYTNRFYKDDSVILIPAYNGDGLELLFIDQAIDKTILI